MDRERNDSQRVASSTAAQETRCMREAVLVANVHRRSGDDRLHPRRQPAFLVDDLRAPLHGKGLSLLHVGEPDHDIAEGLSATDDRRVWKGAAAQLSIGAWQYDTIGGRVSIDLDCTSDRANCSERDRFIGDSWQLDRAARRMVSRSRLGGAP